MNSGLEGKTGKRNRVINKVVDGAKVIPVVGAAAVFIGKKVVPTVVRFIKK